MNLAGVVLCGGRSTRMGCCKAELPFGPEAMLQRVVRLLREAARPLVVVAAAGQNVPCLPADVRLVYDHRPGRGPLEGIYAGLSALPRECQRAYVTACDAPFLVPRFVQRMAELLGDRAIAVPNIEDRPHPLAAVYRRDVQDTIQRLLADANLRVGALLEELPIRRVSAAELLDVDPQLLTLRNLNSPEDYRAALADAGFACREQSSCVWWKN
jgi:molybdopterin-guanine dinucleotide biosynthesis protein A